MAEKPTIVIEVDDGVAYEVEAATRLGIQIFIRDIDENHCEEPVSVTGVRLGLVAESTLRDLTTEIIYDDVEIVNEDQSVVAIRRVDRGGPIHELSEAYVPICVYLPCATV